MTDPSQPALAATNKKVEFRSVENCTLVPSRSDH
jgi:hypothetical protein